MTTELNKSFSHFAKKFGKTAPKEDGPEKLSEGGEVCHYCNGSGYAEGGEVEADADSGKESWKWGGDAPDDDNTKQSKARGFLAALKKGE